MEKVAPEISRADCPLIQSARILGDKWSLMIIRECFFGYSRFEHFQENLKISRSVLSEKLKKLVAEEILEKQSYKEEGRRQRYRYLLSEKGWDLYKVLTGLIEWGRRFSKGKTNDTVQVCSKEDGEGVQLALINSKGRAVGLDDIYLKVLTREEV